MDHRDFNKRGEKKTVIKPSVGDERNEKYTSFLKHRDSWFKEFSVMYLQGIPHVYYAIENFVETLTHLVLSLGMLKRYKRSLLKTIRTFKR